MQKLAKGNSQLEIILESKYKMVAFVMYQNFQSSTKMLLSSNSVLCYELNYSRIWHQQKYKVVVSFILNERIKNMQHNVTMNKY